MTNKSFWAADGHFFWSLWRAFTEMKSPVKVCSGGVEVYYKSPVTTPLMPVFQTVAVFQMTVFYSLANNILMHRIKLLFDRDQTWYKFQSMLWLECSNVIYDGLHWVWSWLFDLILSLTCDFWENELALCSVQLPILFTQFVIPID